MLQRMLVISKLLVDDALTQVIVTVYTLGP